MFRRIKLHIQYVIAHFRVKHLIKKYERVIKKGWEINRVIEDDDAKIDQAVLLMGHEAKLDYYKRLYLS